MKKLFLTVLFMMPSSLFALDTRESEAGCITSKTATELVRCAINESSDVKIQSLNAQSQEKLVSKATQWRNPELDVESVSDGNGNQNTEASMLFDFELFGKRSSRVKRAKAESEIAEKQLLLTKADVAIFVATSLYRMRQIDTEASLVTEAAETFLNVTKPYKGRIRLNPEQEVSLSVFEIAAEENQLRLNNLKQEKEHLASQLRVTLNSSESPDAKILPPLKTNWPAINGAKNESAPLQILAAQDRRATADLDAERAESWPELKLGPKYEKAGREDAQVGVALSLSLPIFSLNGGGRAAAQTNLTRVRLESELARKRIDNERANLEKIYAESGQAIQRSVQNARLKQKHQSLHRLLNQGLVNASLVIEMHRQLFDYQAGLHEQELKGVEAYWKLLALDGRILEGEIK